MLAGQSMFSTAESYQELLDGKRRLLEELPTLLPDEVLASESLMHLIRTLVAPDPIQRFPSAEAADLLNFGAASFHRELVNSDLASEYETEIRLWLQDLS